MEAIRDFVMTNRKPLAGWLRKQLIAAGAGEYVGRLGKTGVEAMERDPAGVLLDLGCALLNRLEPGHERHAEELLLQLPEGVRSQIRLPRGEGHNAILGGLIEEVRRRESDPETPDKAF